MKSSLILHLACPICGTGFTVKNAKKTRDEINNGILVCNNKHKFSISNGVPRFVIDKTKDFVRTEDAFSAKWRIYHNSYHKKNWFEFQRNWFLERFGWNTIENLNKFLKTKKNRSEEHTSELQSH